MGVFVLFTVASSLAVSQVNVFVHVRQTKYMFVQAAVAALRIAGLSLSTMTILKTFSQTGFSASINPKTYRVFEHPYRMFFVLGNISRNKISMGDEKNMSRITLKVNVFKEGDVYVALCPMLNVSSFGDDIEHAKNSLKEALEAFLEECEAMGTLEAVLEETGFVKKKTMWVPEEPIMEEMIALSC
jgi:predicted RNase H-like HicB family nuclease